MMVTSSTGELIVDVVDGGVAIVTLNRPKVRNAINAALTREIESVVRIIEADRAGEMAGAIPPHAMRGSGE